MPGQARLWHISCVRLFIIIPVIVQVLFGWNMENLWFSCWTSVSTGQIFEIFAQCFWSHNFTYGSYKQWIAFPPVYSSWKRGPPWPMDTFLQIVDTIFVHSIPFMVKKFAPSTNWVLSQVTSGGSVTHVHILTYSWSHYCSFHSFHCQRDVSTAYFQNHHYSIFSFLHTLSNYFTYTYFLWWHRYHVQMCLTASPSVSSY